MDPKKLALPDHLLSPRRKHVSGFGLWVGGASFILLSVILLSNSLKGRLVTPLFQGFNSASVTLNSSLVSWPFPLGASYFPTPLRNDGNGSRNGGGSSSSSSNSSGSAGARDDEVYKASGANVVGVALGKTETHPGNSTGRVEDGGFGGNLEDLRDTHLDDLRVTVENGSLPGDGEGGAVVANYSVSDNGSMDASGSKGVEFVQNSSLVNSTLAENSNRGNLSNNGALGVRSPGGKEERVDENQQVTSFEACDIFDGRWVRDDSKPYYPASSCPHIDRDFDCHLNGRPDDGYLKWKWQPNGCDIPSLNATDFLERLRGKKLVFVGDSLNRNMWESLVCILRHSIKDKRRVYEISGRTEFKKKGFYAFRFEDYNSTVDFVGSPFLVRESTFKSKNGTIETLRLDLMDKTTSMYHDADIIVFNTGHWWTHEKTSRGEDYYQEGNIVHPRLNVLKAYKRALQTWARWLEKNIDTNRTQVFFRGYSVTHFRGGQWNSGGRCHKETEPIFNTSYLAKYPSKMRALELVLKETSTPVTYLNISRLTGYRKDGHPSIYRMQYKTSEERIAAERSQDCSHWCLPGVPDLWNELLYASLLKAGKGSWRI